jgi:recombination protein RecA
MSFDKLKQKISKNVKGVHVATMSESNIATSKNWVKTPCLDLNRVLSGNLFKGIQTRTLLGIVGPEHTMKSSFMVLCMVEAQKEGFKPVIIDTEGGCDSQFCKRWGLDPDNVLYIYTPWVNEVKVILAQIKETQEEKYIIGLDSAGGLDLIKSYNDALGGDPKADQGQLQKQIRSVLKLFLNICITQNSVGIICGHLYGKPSSVPMPDQIGGGKAMKLFPNVLINLKKTNIKEGNNIIGNEISATTLKNRVYPPFQTATVSIDYREGINKHAGIIDLGIEAGLIKQAGAWYSLVSDEKLGQGRKNAEKELENFPQLLEDLNKWLEKTGYSTIDENIKEAEKLLQEEVKKETEESEKQEVKEEKEDKKTETKKGTKKRITRKK